MQLSDANATDALDRALTSDIFSQGLACGALSIGVSASEAKVSTSRLANRKAIVITNMGAGVLYWGCVNVTTSIGTPIYKGATVTITAGDLAVYLISSLAATDARIVELA